MRQGMYYKGNQTIVRYAVAFIVLALTISGVTPGSALAAEGESIALSPTSKRYSVEPGDVINDTLKVINDGEEAYKLTFYSRPYSVSNEAYEPVFNQDSPRGDVFRWIQFEQSDATLQPGDSIDLKYTMRVPANADAGGHFGALFAETQPSDDNQDSVVRKKRVAAILYATVGGNNSSSGDVLETSIPMLQVFAPLRANARVENSGNVDFVNSTKLTVTDVFGNKKFENSRELPVLPSTTRSIPYAWEGGSNFGLFKVSVTHAFLDKPAVTTSGYVLLIPLWALLALIGLIIAFIIYTIVNRKRTSRPQSARKRIKRHAKSPTKRS